VLESWKTQLNWRSDRNEREDIGQVQIANKRPTGSPALLRLPPHVRGYEDGNACDVRDVRELIVEPVDNEPHVQTNEPSSVEE